MVSSAVDFDDEVEVLIEEVDSSDEAVASINTLLSVGLREAISPQELNKTSFKVAVRRGSVAAPAQHDTESLRPPSAAPRTRLELTLEPGDSCYAPSERRLERKFDGLQVAHRSKIDECSVNCGHRQISNDGDVPRRDITCSVNDGPISSGP